MTTLPTGEQLPEYDDPGEQPIDVAKLQAWMRDRQGWGAPDAFIRDVLTALQAVGDATLVRNATYRAMRRDGAEVERLSAWLVNHGMAHALMQADGNPVDAAITGLDAAQAYAAREGDRIKRLLVEHGVRTPARREPTTGQEG